MSRVQVEMVMEEKCITINKTVCTEVQGKLKRFCSFLFLLQRRCLFMIAIFTMYLKKH